MKFAVKRKLIAATRNCPDLKEIFINRYSEIRRAALIGAEKPGLRRKKVLLFCVKIKSLQDVVLAHRLAPSQYLTHRVGNYVERLITKDRAEMILADLYHGIVPYVQLPDSSEGVRVIVISEGLVHLDMLPNENQQSSL